MFLTEFMELIRTLRTGQKAYRDLLALARELRQAQKKYFTGGRLQGDLIASKDVEGRIDRLLKDDPFNKIAFLEDKVDKALKEGVTLYATPAPTEEEQLKLFERLSELGLDDPDLPNIDA